MVRLPDLEPVPGHAWDAAGLEAEARTTILRLVANYNHANSLNFLAMLVARSVLRGEGEGQDAPASPPCRRRPLRRNRRRGFSP